MLADGRGRFTGSGARAKSEIFAWRLGNQGHLAQLDPYLTTIRRLWPAPDDVLSLVYEALQERRCSDALWRCLESALCPGMLPIRDSYAGLVLGQGTDSRDPAARGAAVCTADILQPTLVSLEVGRICNLKCQFCYLRDSLASGGRIGSLSTLARAAERAAEAGALFFNITGGEPTLHPDIAELLDHASSLGLAVVLRTNLFRLPGGLSQVRNKERIVFATSYHDADAESFDLFVGRPGACSRILRNITNLREGGFKVRAHVVVTRRNVRSLGRIIDQLRRVDVPLTITDQVLPTLPTPYSDAVNPSSAGEQDAGDDEHIGAADSLDLQRQGLISRERRVCSAGRGKLWLGPDGSVYACELFRSNPIGDYIGHSLMEITRSRRVAEWREVHVSEPDECACCPLRSGCPRCPALSSIEHGVVNRAHVPTCSLTREIAALRPSGS